MRTRPGVARALRVRRARPGVGGLATIVSAAIGLVAFAAIGASGCADGDRSTREAGDRNRELIVAAWENDVERARELIADGADVDHKDDTVQSAYLIAASEGHLELLELTLDNGADVTSLDSYNGTALIRAAERGHADVVERLLATDIDVDHVNNLGWTALHEAIILGDGSERYVQTIRLLIDAGADPTLPTGDGEIPLALAIERRQDAVAALLRAADDG